MAKEYLYVGEKICSMSQEYYTATHECFGVGFAKDGAIEECYIVTKEYCNRIEEYCTVVQEICSVIEEYDSVFKKSCMFV